MNRPIPSTSKLCDLQIPVVLIQWSRRNDPSEMDELAEVSALLEFLNSTHCNPTTLPNPSMAQYHLDSDIFHIREELAAILDRHSKCQVLFFSAHGSPQGFSKVRDDGLFLPYEDFGTLLSTIEPEACLHLVLGACEAMAEDVPWPRLLPVGVHRVTGFVGCPHGTDTAGLVAAILLDDLRLFSEFAEDGKIHGAGLLVDTSGLIWAWERTIDAFNFDPTQGDVTREGRTIIQLHRDPNSGAWVRESIQLLPNTDFNKLT